MKPSTAWIAEVNPDALKSYKEMRAQLLAAPGIDPVTCEIIVVMQLAALGYELPFKLHSIRAMGLGITKAQLQGYALSGLGVTLVAPEAARALEWLESANAQFESAKPSQ